MLLRWAFLSLLISPLLAQGTCQVAYPPITPPGPTMFSPEQEGFLGDFFEEWARRTTSVYPQQGLTERMNQIVGRLLQFLPAHDYTFQLTLIELPDANAYAIPGGRIFVSRRLVASLESEDELAGLLAHEMGHVLARQQSVETTKYLREGFNVTSVGDRADIYAKLTALIDAPSRVYKIRGTNRDDDQAEADRISSEATWRAGYDPAALPRWIDRMTNNNGQTGNFLGDLLGNTRPVSKRYREMLKSVEGIPAACRQGRAADEESFLTWQKRVTDLAPEDLLTTNATRTPATRLLPVLRRDLSNIRFSPDGHSLLAQDQAGITILNADPLGVRMRIPALAARQAFFHKDSQRVFFQTGTGRIEIWNLQTQVRERRVDLPLGVRCAEVILSPDAKTFACMTPLGRDVVLYDLDSGEIVGQHGYLHNTLGQGVFSPDGSTFLHGTQVIGDSPWAFSLAQRKEVAIGSPLRGAMNANFVFMDEGRIAAITYDTSKSGVFSFPEGKQLLKLTIPESVIFPVTKGDTLLLRPVGGYAVGLLDVNTREIFQVSTKGAVDRYGDLGASERNTGELALYRGKSAQPVATVNLAAGELTGLRSGVHSSDFSWLALSTPTRGQIWNLRDGRSVLTAPFDGGAIGPDGTWTATFEQREQKPGSSAFTMEKFRVATDLNAGKDVSSVKIAREKGVRSLFSEKYEVRVASADGKKKASIEVREAASGKLQWMRSFEETPQVHLGNALVVRMAPEGKDGREITKQLKQRGVPSSKDSALLDVLNLETGKSEGQLLIEIGSTVRGANVVGGTLYLEDANNRALAYDLSSGQRTGQQFGRVLATDTAHGRVAVSNKLGSVSVLDKGLRGIAEFEYPRNVIYAGFDGLGKKLLVVTGTEEVFVETLPE